MYKKQGISLIVLVITIVVMIILSSTVILNVMTFDGRISETQEAKVLSDIVAFRDEMNMHLAKDPRVNLDSIFAEYDNMLNYIPSMQDIKTANGVLYTDVLVIDGGKLKVRSGILEEEEEDVIAELIDRYTK